MVITTEPWFILSRVQEPEPDISLLFELFVAGQRMRRVMDAALQGAPLRPDEYAVYSLLFVRGPLTASQLARFTGLPLSTALDHLRAMNDRGHLRRSRHPRDGRAQVVSLTAAGLAAHAETGRAWRPMVEALEAKLGPEVEGIRSALRLISDAAEELAGGWRVRSAADEAKLVGETGFEPATT